MKSACVLGMGISGKAAARYLEKLGFSVTRVDDDPTLGLSPQEIAIENFSLFVPSPGVPRTHLLYVAAKRCGVEMSSEMELGLCLLKDHICIAVTGTNGKTTVVNWIKQLLQRAKIPAQILGNDALPLLDYLEQEKKEEVLIIEVSSFQLETMRQKTFDLGFILNITEDHLYRYRDFAEYGQVKCHLQNLVRGKLYVYEKVLSDFRKELAPSLESHLLETYSIDPTIQTERFTATHDLENATAVWQVARYFGISHPDFLAALDCFVKPAHRLEYVAAINGVTYYNDSKATNVDAQLKALGAMTEPVVLLAGGVDKGGSFLPLVSFKEKIRCIFAFGQCREKMAEQLKDALPVEVCTDMQEAVAKAKLFARSGETILLSPGCSSFDSFKNYAHRGEEFRKIILTGL